jgi:DNA-binding NarL/FixJ family response regulator
VAISLFIMLQERTFADALAIRLAQELDVEVVGALEQPLLFAGSRVDVVLLDADIAGDAAFRMCRVLSQNNEAPRVIFLSHSADPERIARGIRAGAVGWVCQYESLDQLLHVIRGAAKGEMLVPPGETAAVLRLLMRGPDPDRNGGAQLLAAPKGREREILVCLAEGTRRRDVARDPDLPPNTVRTHLQNLMGKLSGRSIQMATSSSMGTTLTLTKRPTSSEGCKGRTFRAVLWQASGT